MTALATATATDIDLKATATDIILEPTIIVLKAIDEYKKVYHSMEGKEVSQEILINEIDKVLEKISNQEPQLHHYWADIGFKKLYEEDPQRLKSILLNIKRQINKVLVGGKRRKRKSRKRKKRRKRRTNNRKTKKRKRRGKKRTKRRR